MTKEEAINKINEIQNKAYSLAITDEDKKEFNRIQREILTPMGFKIAKRKYGYGEICWILKDLNLIKAKRDSRFVCEWVNKDMSPDHKHLKGNCTTRAISYCLIGSMTYDEIENEQYRLAEEYHTRRNTRGTWEQVLIQRGWCSISLYNNTIRADRIARMLKDIEFPTVIISSHHASIADKGNIVDSWDSRGKRIQKVLVKDEVVEKVRQILFPSAPKCIPHFL